MITGCSNSSKHPSSDACLLTRAFNQICFVSFEPKVINNPSLEFLRVPVRLQSIGALPTRTDLCCLFDEFDVSEYVVNVSSHVLLVTLLESLLKCRLSSDRPRYHAGTRSTLFSQRWLVRTERRLRNNWVSGSKSYLWSPTTEVLPCQHFQFLRSGTIKNQLRLLKLPSAGTF